MLADLLIPVGQVGALGLIVVGIALLPVGVRVFITKTYADITLDRIGSRVEHRANELAKELCRFVYQSRDGRTSVPKCLLIGFIDTSLIALPYLILFSGIGFGNGEQHLKFHALLVLPATVAMHGAMEYASATALKRLLQQGGSMTRVIFLMAGAVLGILVCAAAIAVVGLATIILTLGAPVWVASLLVGGVATGPTLLIWTVVEGSPMQNFVFWLAVGSVAAFSAAVIIPSLAFLVSRSRAFHSTLAHAVMHMGNSSGPMLIGSGVTLFGFFADLSSSNSALLTFLSSLF